MQKDMEEDHYLQILASNHFIFIKNNSMFFLSLRLCSMAAIIFHEARPGLPHQFQVNKEK